MRTFINTLVGYYTLSLLTPFSGAISGCLAKTAVYPLDVMKKRFQVIGFEEARVSFGRLPASVATAKRGLITLTCLWQLMLDEGVTGLFKGWTQSMLKAGITTSLTFSFFELYRSLLT